MFAEQILARQLELQRKLAERGKAIDPSQLVHGNVGEFVDYIRDMKEYLNMEVEEILQTLPIEARKPWKAIHNHSRQYPVSGTAPLDVIQHEAIDALCFMLNIVLACGVQPEQFEIRFSEVLNKNLDRAEHGY